jgi:GTP pyrophosphokinase
MAQSELKEIEESLIKSCQVYFSPGDLKGIKKAVDLAKSLHSHQKRKSGKPYITHPLNTALRLSKIRLDKDGIIAAVLHDTLEDTNIKPPQIRKMFGNDVLSLIESVTKLGRVRIKKSWFPFFKAKKIDITEFERQVETLRKMLVAVAKDVRVILIKLSDKIDNLETLEYLEEDRRERIAKEAIEIYAPIAGRLGINEWKDQLEDLSFPYVYPKEYKQLRELAIPEIKTREKYLKFLSGQVSRMLSKNKIKHKIVFRAKRWYSLFKKLKKYDGDISKVHDLVALRIILDSIEDCYCTMGLIHNRWKPLPGRIKDYIAMPKPNGYQSLHTTIFCEKNQIVEFQIRTKNMHHQAEYGVASHWIYDDEKKSRQAKKQEVEWLKEFSVFQKKIKSSHDLANSLSLDVFQDRIFVFTPKGDAKDPPVNSTPVDFAYSVHTDIGNHCGGARVNDKIAPLNYKLCNGDIVDIIVSKKARPRQDWLEFVVTEMARTNIKKRTR